MPAPRSKSDEEIIFPGYQLNLVCTPEAFEKKLIRHIPGGDPIQRLSLARSLFVEVRRVNLLQSSDAMEYIKARDFRQVLRGVRKQRKVIASARKALSVACREGFAGKFLKPPIKSLESADRWFIDMEEGFMRAIKPRLRRKHERSYPRDPESEDVPVPPFTSKFSYLLVQKLEKHINRYQHETATLKSAQINRLISAAFDIAFHKAGFTEAWVKNVRQRIKKKPVSLRYPLEFLIPDSK